MSTEQAHTPHDDRHVRVFISSTFKGMFDERDELINKTFPLLRRKAMERGVVMTDVDLRWGITPNDSKSGKVVEICFHEIERSIPYFIGIIGDRYGWIPDRSDLTANTLERYGSVEGYLDRKISVTEMEMQFGVLERPERMNAFFYVKNSKAHDKDEGAFYHEKLDELRAAVAENGRYPVSFYSTPEELAGLVERDFSALLDEYFPKAMSQTELEDSNQRFAVRRYLECFVPQQQDIEDMDRFVSEYDSHVLLVTGCAGSGKSALLSNWAAHSQSHVIYHNVSLGTMDGSGFSMVRRVLRLLGQCMGVEVDMNLDSVGSASALYELVSEAETASEMPVIILDGLDSIPQPDLAACLSWIPRSLKNIKIICSAASGSYAADFLMKRGYASKEVSMLSLPERALFVWNYLEHYHSKHLEQYQVNNIAGSPLAENPSMLRIMLNEFAGFGVHEQLDSYISELTDYLTPDSFYEGYLGRIENLFGKSLVSDIFSYLLVSREGLHEQSIIDLTACSRLQLSQVMGYLLDSLSVVNGLVLISDSSLKHAAKTRYIPSVEEGNKYREHIIETLNGKKDASALREVSYQYRHMKRWGDLKQFIIHPDTFHTLYVHDYDALFFICSDLQREAGFSLGLCYDGISSCLSDEDKAVHYTELAVVARMLRESRVMEACSKRLKAIIDAPSCSLGNSLKQSVVHSLYNLYKGQNWYYADLLDFAEREIALLENPALLEKEDIRNNIALSYMNRFRLKEAKTILDEIISQALSADIQDKERNRHLADYYRSYSELYRSSSNPDRLEKIAEYERIAFDYAGKAYGDDSPQMARFHLDLAVAESCLGNRETVDVHCARAEELVRFYFNDDSPQMEECLAYQIKTLHYLEDYDGMKALIERAMPLFESSPKRPNVTGAFKILDDLMWQSQKPEIRVLISKTEVTLYRKFYGRAHPLAMKIHDLGDAYSWNGDYQDAINAYDEALDILWDTYTEHDKRRDRNEILWCLDGISECYRKQGRPEMAKQTDKKAREYMRKYKVK